MKGYIELRQADEPPGIVSCRGCGDPILWYTTTAGKKMPVNADATVIEREGASYVRSDETHWATCPEAGKFRR